MSILINKDTKVLCKVLLENMAPCIQSNAWHGTQLVGGTSPGKGGSTHLSLPVFNTVRECVDATGADASMILSQQRFVKMQF